MNIFGVGGWELILIVLIALIVAGPKRMAHWAYIAGGYIGQLRTAWRNMMVVVQKEFDDAGVDIKVPRDIPNQADINRFAGQLTEPLAKQYREAANEVNNDLREVKDITSMKDNNGTSHQSSGNVTNGNSAKSFGTWSAGRNTTPPPSDTQTSAGQDFGTWSTDSKSNTTDNGD